MDAPVATDQSGLTSAEVEERRRGGLVNAVPEAPTRTFGEIVRANVLTPVNGIIGVMFAIIMMVAPGPDALFAGVVISNSVIGIVQELRAKRTLDKLAVLSAPKATVVRDGTEHTIGTGEVVADDLMILRPGDQVVVDGTVVVSESLELNESLLTGESDPVVKDEGAEVLSGSFVASGSGSYRADRIGAASYASSLAEEARQFRLVDSELRNGINLILRWLVWIIPPVALLLLIALLRVNDSDDGWRDALVGTVAASVAMVPDGLVLLTSVSFIVGVLALARRQALAKELAAVELLARVDVLCLDKTGTITTGEIAFAELVTLDSGGVDEAEVRAALGASAAADPSPNATLAAVAREFAVPEGWEATDAVPFSSARKWASVTFAERGTWFLGAPEVLLAGLDGDDAAVVMPVLERQAEAGRRVVLLARSDEAPTDEHLPPARRAVALVLFEDRVREDAPEILAYLRSQGISLKVISGDHPATVAAVARRAGVSLEGQAVDARTLPTDDDELADVLDRSQVFGRVTPHQKRQMVGALQSRDHVVAMTGDGVNDVLALKDADMGIAMGSGSSASRSVAELVLLDDAFSSLPRVLSEGRRVIANIERVANLFVVKASYAVLLALLIGVLQAPFLFLPRHFTLVGTFSIGVPGFFLALEPTDRRALPGFVARVVRFAVPAGIVAALCTIACYEWFRRSGEMALDEARTSAVCVLLGIGLVVLVLISRPLRAWHTGLVAAMAASYAVVLSVEPLREFFALDLPPRWAWAGIAAAVAVGAVVLVVGPHVVPGWWQAASRPDDDEEPAAAVPV
ncbi:MAG: HAD-IC family P-type ATPase [Actinomycetota bacterium]|nr:HAD-IC family P-type ATPase [Actinomycetota bacterium]